MAWRLTKLCEAGTMTHEQVGAPGWWVDGAGHQGGQAGGERGGTVLRLLLRHTSASLPPRLQQPFRAAAPMDRRPAGQPVQGLDHAARARGRGAGAGAAGRQRHPGRVPGGGAGRGGEPGRQAAAMAGRGRSRRAGVRASGQAGRRSPAAPPADCGVPAPRVSCQVAKHFCDLEAYFRCVGWQGGGVTGGRDDLCWHRQVVGWMGGATTAECEPGSPATLGGMLLRRGRGLLCFTARSAGTSTGRTRGAALVAQAGRRAAGPRVAC